MDCAQEGCHVGFSKGPNRFGGSGQISGSVGTRLPIMRLDSAIRRPLSSMKSFVSHLIYRPRSLSASNSQSLGPEPLSPFNLPPELYRPIVEAVEYRNDLLSLLFVSHHLHDEAERVLYHDLRIEQESRQKQIRLFQRLAHGRGDVASHVRYLSIDDNSLELQGRRHPGIGDVEDRSDGDLVYLCLMHAALERMVNLRFLTLTLHSDHIRRGLEPTTLLFDGSDFYPPRMTIYGSRPLDIQRLEQEAAVKRMRVRYTHQIAAHTTTSFPTPSILAGNAFSLPRTGPSKACTWALEWRNGDLTLPLSTTSLYAQVETPEDMVHLLHRSLPDLIYLRAAFNCRVLENSSLFWSFSHILSRLPRLRKLQLHQSEPKRYHDASESRLTSSLFARFPSLDAIVLSFGDASSRVWVRNGEEGAAFETDGHEWATFGATHGDSNDIISSY